MLNSVYSQSFIDVERFFRHAEKLTVPGGVNLRGAASAMSVLKDKAMEYLVESEGGRKLAARKPGKYSPIWVKKEPKRGTVAVTARQNLKHNDRLMHWLVNGTGPRDTKGKGPIIKKPAHRGVMKIPRGKYIERALSSAERLVFEKFNKWINSYLNNWNKT